MLKSRKLGQRGLEVSSIGLGCMGMSFAYGTPDDAESIATVHRALDLGCSFFDTAEIYGPYTNEDLLGRALAGRRNEAMIATKFGFRIENGKRVGNDSSPAQITRAVEGSLTRLQTDHIDLLFQHRLDRAVPIEEVAGAVSELVRQGKVRYFGLSEVGVATIRRAHAVHPVSALQSEYSLWERNLEADVLPVLRELGIGLVPFSPLGRGFLTGTAKRADAYPQGDYRQRFEPRIQGENFDANMRATAVVRDIAVRKGITPAQLSLAWLLAKGDDIVPIPGTKRRAYLEENLTADDVVLTTIEVRELDECLPPGSVAGPRYIEPMMADVER